MLQATQRFMASHNGVVFEHLAEFAVVQATQTFVAGLQIGVAPEH